MSYTALYREWRPQIFEDVVGQEHIKTTLKNQIKNNKTAHAYLFCGTRGTGKTTMAKIMAKALNCLNLQDGEPCNECEMCKSINAGLNIDVTEVDAASNNKVENIRDMIEDVQYPPREARNKVYIMDEVHMLSTGAVNAFLKTLEEPPSNVVFILATTDPQKLPITILSRCQRFDFKRIKTEDVSGRLREIVTDKGVLADENSLNLIARMSDGAMRDALSVLDQAISMGEGKVQYDDVLDMLGLVTNENLLALTDAAIKKDTEKAMNIIEDIVISGKDIYTFIKDLTNHMRNLLMVKVSNNPQQVVDMSSENIDLIKVQGSKINIEEIMRFIRILQDAEEQAKWSKQARIYLELAVIKMCRVEFDTSPEVMLSRINRIEDAIRNGTVAVTAVSSEEGNEGATSAKKFSSPKKTTARKAAEDQEEMLPITAFNEASTLTLDKVEKSWKDIIDTFKNRRLMVIYASLLTGKLSRCEKGVVEIVYTEQFAFNKQRLDKEDNRRLVDGVFSEILRENVKVTYRVMTSEPKGQTKEEKLKEVFQNTSIEIIE